MLRKQNFSARYHPLHKNFDLANFGKNFGKRTSPNAAKKIKTLYKQLHNQEIFEVEVRFLGIGTV